MEIEKSVEDLFPSDLKVMFKGEFSCKYHLQILHEIVPINSFKNDNFTKVHFILWSLELL